MCRWGMLAQKADTGTKGEIHAATKGIRSSAPLAIYTMLYVRVSLSK